MKNWILFISLFSFLGVYAQQQNSFSSVKEGDEIILGKFTGPQDYKFVSVGKPNFIIKKGGIYQPRYLKGTRVVVKDVKQRNGKTTWVLTPVNDAKFYQTASLAYVTDVENAIKSGEIVVP